MPHARSEALHCDAFLQQGPFIARSLTSVLNQSYRAIELIVMDGGSTDQTLDVLRHFSRKDARLRWYSEKDAGQADAVNKVCGAPTETSSAG